MKNTLKIVYTILFLILFMCLTLFYNFFFAKREYKNVNINIKKGTNFAQIYKDLKLKYGIVDKIYLKLNGGNIKLKVGTYKFNGKFSKYEIIKKIKSSETNGIRLTIPEGFTSKQVFARMEALELGNREEINKVLSEMDFPYPHENNNFEGYFYPETYIFSENVTTKQVIQTILGEFLKKFPPEKYPDKQKFYDNLKMASIVEAEVPDAVDKPGRQASRNELKSQNTPYNSYKVKGLPPTPIGNPPIETFKAVLNAEKTDNLFFFTYKGKTYYSKTHEEHLKKRRESGQLK